VKQAESDQIVAAMRARGLEVLYVLFEDEGHGFARPENQRKFIAAVEPFLARHLGGRAEPPAEEERWDGLLR
jgi:dipeptidyl aminopeptidase/acylaminoacyl peptidase